VKRAQRDRYQAALGEPCRLPLSDAGSIPAASTILFPCAIEMDAIFKRRSIRSFRPDPLDEPSLEKLLAAAMAAPSAGNEQPWHFVVVKDRALLEQLSQASPYAQPCAGAAAAIVVCCDPSLVKHEGFWVQDCAAATQNILLEATDLGIGSVWIGIHPRAEREGAVRKILSIPPTIVPFSIVALGYPAEEKPPVDRYMRDRVHREQW
jgi:nitroreductase